MIDREDSDDKILSVPINDPRYNHIKKINDIPEATLNEIMHFFKEYKTLEGEKTKVLGWENAEEALKALNHSIELYNKNID